MDLVVKGRNVEVPEHFRAHVADKLQKMERYDHKLIEVRVELLHERNRRQQANCQRVEITCVSRGPVIRAEACAGDFYSALDLALGKLETRMRRAADRRRIHRGRRAPVSVAAATAALAAADPTVTGLPAAGVALAEREDDRGGDRRLVDDSDAEIVVEAEAPEDGDDQPWRVVRLKEHPNDPITVDDALFQMELVGHDFYLFNDKASGRPSVVYRRRGYDYGVISLASQ